MRGAAGRASGGAAGTGPAGARVGAGGAGRVGVREGAAGAGPAGVRGGAGAAAGAAVRRRRAAAAGAGALALAVGGLLAGCGGGAAGGQAGAAPAPAPAPAAATVDGVPVTRREYDARRRLELLDATGVATGRPALQVPALVRFDGTPAQCAADVRRLATPGIGAAVARRGDAKLRAYCRGMRRKVTYQTVGGLLAGRVTAAEARRLGVHATAAEVTRAQQALYERLGGRGASSELAAGGRLDRRVLRARARVAVLEAKLSQLIVARDGRVTEADRRVFFARHRDRFDRGARPGRLRSVLTQAIAPAKAERALAAWQERTRDRWRPRIDCAPGFAVVELCGNAPLGGSEPKPDKIG
jgi:hypothetical protein